MDAAINCLERELAMLAGNFAATADALAMGRDPDLVEPEAQQNLRWSQMEGLRRGIASLRHVKQSQAPQEAYRPSYHARYPAAATQENRP